MKRGWGIILAMITATALGASTLFAAYPVSLAEIQKVIPGASSPIQKTAPVDHYLVYGKQGELVGIAFLTTSIAPRIKGYRGEIHVLVGMDPSGTIEGVAVVDHDEIPEYMKIITESGFFDTFIGRTLESGFGDIDAVTSATVSSKAIKRDIASALSEMYRQPLGGGIIGWRGGTAMGFVDILAIIVTALLIAGSIATTMVSPKRWLRITLWSASFVIIGVWLNVPLTIGVIADMRLGIIPVYIPFLMLFGFAVLAALAKSNLYCAHLCPFGAMQEGAYGLSLPRCTASGRAQHVAARFRLIVLVVTIGGIVAGISAFRVIEPFSLCFSRVLTTAVIVQTCAVIVAALFIKKPWCRFFCPTGAVLDFIGDIGQRVWVRVEHMRKKAADAKTGT